jgi:opacity protein-like surface antigen
MPGGAPPTPLKIPERFCLAAPLISGKSAPDMKPFITLTFCAIVFGAFAIAQADPEPIATQNKPEPKPDSVSYALLTGESFSWTGLYIGGNLGGTLSNFGFHQRDAAVDTVQQFNEAFDDTFDDFGVGFFDITHKTIQEGSILGGVQTGGMFQFGHFVVGVEGDFERLAPHVDRKFTGIITTDDPIVWDPDDFIAATTTLVDRQNAECNWNASVRGKLGWAHGPLLFYATGGVVWSDMDVQQSQSASTTFFIEEEPPPAVINPRGTGGGARRVAAPAQPLPDDFVFLASQSTRTGPERHSKTYFGWTAGGGVDLALTDVLTVALEYRHNDFGDETFHFSDESDLSSHGPIFSEHTRIDLDSDQVTIRVNLMVSRFFFGH